jgi:hypothetical protein
MASALTSSRAGRRIILNPPAARTPMITTQNTAAATRPPVVGAPVTPRETAEEYRRRTGLVMDPAAAGPAEPAAAGPPLMFRIIAGFAEHDERLGASASIDVRRDTPPSPAEAERLIWPEIWDVTTRALGDGDWPPSLNWPDVIELRAG